MKFREKSLSTKTENFAGGEAFTESKELELISLVLTSFVDNKFYESVNSQLSRLEKLVDEIKDKKFIAQVAIYARNEFGMRSITQALIVELLRKVNKTEWMKYAVNSTIRRPDDALEMLAYYYKKNENRRAPISKALAKGIVLAINKFSPYQLAKYRGERSDVKLVDLLNILHIKPNENTSETFKDLINGSLKSVDEKATWESKLTQAGQQAKTEEEKIKLKSKVWFDLIKEKKLGYFALLRNLKNIVKQSPEILDEALKQLIDENAIKKSLVLPFRYVTAMKEIVEIPDSRKVIQALSKATDISLSNVPKFDGKTLVALDVSGSMAGKPIEIGSLFAAALAKSNDADIIVFNDDANYKNINPEDSLTSIARQLNSLVGGTNFNCIFEKANKKYDRIIILSDMQGWIGYYSPMNVFAEYKLKTGANPHIYSFDLNGYGTISFPEKQIYCITGFSEKIFDIMKLLEKDRKALINEIKKVKIQ